MTPVEVVLISGSFTLVGSVLAWFLARLQKNADRRADSSTPGTPTVQEIWKRQDGMENAFKASLVLLAEAVEQHNDPGSIQFNDTAVKTLRASGYMPPELENVLKKSTEEGGN